MGCVFCKDKVAVHCSFDEFGNPHSYNNKPAIITRDGTIYRYKHGEIHGSNDLPAIIDKKKGIFYWYKNDKLHRKGKPAIISTRDSYLYYENGIEIEHINTYNLRIKAAK